MSLWGSKNEFLPEYDETKESTSIQYVDFNNHYRWALSQLLAYARFDYVEDISMFTHDFIINYNKNSDLGYTLIVDADYPKYLKPLY